MKKIVIVAAIIIAVIVAGILAIKGQQDNEDKVVRVGLVLNGSASDRSWSQSHYEGMEKTAQELGFELVYRENVAESDLEKTVDELVGLGSEIVVCNSYGYGQYLGAVSDKYPEGYFLHASGVESGGNVTSFFGRMYQIRYLCGVAAGLQTENNAIGYVAAFPIPEVNRGINAFTLGVRSVNPQAQVYVNWTDSWVDDTSSQKASQELIDKYGIDILTMHVDSIAPLKVADDNGIMSIGYNFDNSALYEDSFLTAAVWSWENFYIPRISECLQERFKGRSYWEGVETGIVSLAPLSSKADPVIAEKINEEKERLMSGVFDVFYGPVKDSNGDLRIAEGESMSDDAMLNSFDWYTEGVIIYEE